MPAPVQTALPSEADLSPEELVEACAGPALALAHAVAHRQPGEVAAALAAVPGGRVDALAVVLAAMLAGQIEPAADAERLLAWTDSDAVDAEYARLRAAGVRTDWVARVLAVEAGRRTDPRLVGLPIEERHRVLAHRERDAARGRRRRREATVRRFAAEAARTRARLAPQGVA